MPRHAIPASNKIDLDLNEFGEGRVVVNGFDLSNVVDNVWSMGHDGGDGGFPTLTVRFGGAIAAHAEGQVQVDEETAEALKALGWTPPSSDDDGEE